MSASGTRRFRQLLDGSPEAGLLTDATGRVVAANPAACSLLRRTEREICEVGRLGLVETADPHVPCANEQRAAIGQCVEETTLVRGDGTTFPAQVFTSAAFSDNGASPLTAMIVRDLTAHKAAEAELAEYRRRFEDLVRERAEEMRETGAMLRQGRAEHSRAEAAAVATERRLAHDALAQSERRYRSLFEDSPVAMWEEDHSAVKAHLEQLVATGVDDVVGYLLEHPAENAHCVALARVLDVNRAAVALFEASSREELLERVDELYPSGAVAGLPAFWAAMLAGARSASSEETNVTLAGRELRVLETCTVAPGHEDTFDRVYVADIDVTERRQAADFLAKYQLLATEARDIMLFVKAADGRIVEANAAAEAAYGYSRQELLELDMQTLCVDSRGPSVGEQMKAAGAGGILFETEHRRKDGSVFPVEVSSRGTIMMDGVAVLLSVIRDITDRKRTESVLTQTTARLELTLKAAVAALGVTAELRDPYTAGHQRRVAELACAIATELGWAEERIESLHTAALLHDIGKIVVPAEILSKPGRLSETEMLLIREHAGAGAEVVADIDFGEDIAEMIRQHHERLDGSGYPAGLKDEDILPEARILAVADVVEAMVSHRPYRPALPLEAALGELENGAGSRYDAVACEAAIRLFREQGFTFAE